jgi:hypothetical protein
MKTGIELQVRIVNGVLVPATPHDSSEFMKFQARYKKILPESFKIWLDTEEVKDKNRPQYLAKLHKQFRIISTDTGNDFSEIKAHVKNENGVTSFEDCDTEELGKLINFTTAFADELGIKT